MNVTTKQIYLVSAIVIFFSFLKLSQCQIDGDISGDINNPAVLPYLTQVIYSRLSNATSSVLTSEISSQFKFCIKDPYVFIYGLTNYLYIFFFANRLPVQHESNSWPPARDTRVLTTKHCTDPLLADYFSSALII